MMWMHLVGYVEPASVGERWIAVKVAKMMRLPKLPWQFGGLSVVLIRSNASASKANCKCNTPSALLESTVPQSCCPNVVVS